ncbi:MAG: hypothetical protein KGZ70_08875 [Hydrogenophaga sp.]|nr:hypothetical protein [Hydrogenophaga sp.]
MIGILKQEFFFYRPVLGVESKHLSASGRCAGQHMQARNTQKCAKKQQIDAFHL